MSLQVKVGQFISSTLTGDQTISHANFTGKALILFTAGKQTSDGWRNDYRSAVGFATSSSHQACSSRAADNGQSSSTAEKARRLSSNIISMVDSLGNVIADADFVEFTSTGFKLNWTTVPASGFVIHYLLIGGSGVQAKVHEWDRPSTTGNQSITGVGFRGDAMITLWSDTGGIGNVTTRSHGGIGATDGTSQWAMQDAGWTNSSTNLPRRVQVTNCCAVYIGTTSIVAACQFSSFTSDGFNVTWPTQTSGTGKLFSLVLKGVTCKVGVISKTAQTPAPATQTITGLGITPKVGLFASFCRTSSSNVESHGRRAMGVSTVTDEEVCFHSDHQASTTDVDALDKTGKAMVIHDSNSQTTSAECDLTSLSAGSFTLTWTTNANTFEQLTYFMLGDGPDGGSETRRGRMFIGGHFS